jgi:hypothetical protein
MRFKNVILSAILMTASVAAMAQIDTGSIVGTVTDSTGAVIPQAPISVKNQATGVQATVTTNAQGQYESIALIPGVYSVSSILSGFAPQTFKDIRVDVQSHIAINFKLNVGGAMQEVTVSDSTAGQLQTQSADLGGVVNTQTINDLPLNGRNYAQLALLDPGVGKYYAGPNEVSDGFSVNGNSELQNYFALDGVDNNSNSANLIESSTQAVQPPPDALEEFRIQTRTYSAEFGNAAGGVVNASIKSGTNHFHGDAWDYLRNEDLDANDFFDNYYGNPRAPYKQNQFGGTIGGPIRRNRTFFFADYQQVLIHQKSTEYSTVPTLLMKGMSPLEPGVFDFKELNGIPLTTVVPSQTGCIVGTVVQPQCIDPVGEKLLQAYPNPNIPSQVALAGQPGTFGNSNYEYIVPVPNNTWSMDAKIDQTINEKNRIYGRYSLYHSDGVDPQWTSNPVIGTSNFAANTQTHGQSFVLSYIRTLSPSMVNEARVGFNRILGANDPSGGLPLGQSDEADFGLTGVPVTPYTYGIPSISVGLLQTLGDSTYRPQHYASQVYQVFDDLTWLRGRHSFKFGYQYHRLTSNFLDLSNVQGAMNASGQYSANDQFGGTDLLLGDMQSASYETLDTPHLFQPGHNFYGQDTWRITDTLVLNYGIRYELYSPLLERDNEVANFSPANGGSLITATPGDTSWYGRSLIHPDRLNFAPRVGFTYQLVPKIVFRGGYGIFYQHHNRYGSESVLNLNPPFLNQTSISQPNGSPTPAFVLQDGFPAASLLASAGVTPPLYEFEIRAQDPNQRTAYVSQPSFGTQIQVTPGTTLSIDYVGNFARKMARLMNANQGQQAYDANGNFLGAYFTYQNLINYSGVGPQNPHFYTEASELEYLRNDGNDNFNSLQASLDHKMSHGFQAGVSYEWAHSFQDYNVPINGDFIGQNAYYNHRGERGNSTLDVRNRFVAHALWAIPVGRGGQYFNSTPVVKDVIAGWQLNGIYTVQGGDPYTIYGDQDDQEGYHEERADCLANPRIGATRNAHKFIVGGGGYYTNPAAYGDPASDTNLGGVFSRVGHFGTCGPYNVYAPGYRDTDLSVFRSFPIHDLIHLEFRAEAFNAFNNVNWGVPYGYIGNRTSFGTVSSTAGSPRNLQFALKIFY